MRSLAGCVALAMMLLGGPLAAEENLAISAAATAATGERQIEAAAVVPKAQATEPASAVPAASGPVELSALPLQEQLPPPPPPPPPITLVLKADLGAQRLTVIENGKAKHVWLISSGRPGFATKTGTFRPQWASKMWFSRQYEYAPMPHAVFFNRGTAFHGTGAVGLLGRPASHGCVRLAPGNAAQLFKLVHKHGYAQTKVVVHGGGKGPAVAGRSDKRRHAALAQPTQRKGYRVSRYNARRPAYSPF